MLNGASEPHVRVVIVNPLCDAQSWKYEVLEDLTVTDAPLPGAFVSAHKLITTCRVHPNTVITTKCDSGRQPALLGRVQVVAR